jgi:hypothetical protein
MTVDTYYLNPIIIIVIIIFIVALIRKFRKK